MLNPQSDREDTIGASPDDGDPHECDCDPEWKRGELIESGLYEWFGECSNCGTTYIATANHNRTDVLEKHIDKIGTCPKGCSTIDKEQDDHAILFFCE